MPQPLRATPRRAHGRPRRPRSFFAYLLAGVSPDENGYRAQVMDTVVGTLVVVRAGIAFPWRLTSRPHHRVGGPPRHWPINGALGGRILDLSDDWFSARRPSWAEKRPVVDDGVTFQQKGELT